LGSTRLQLLSYTPGEETHRIERTQGTPETSPRVLLVDDHDLFRTGLRTLLGAEGVDVVGEARNGTEALAEVRALAPDVVVMDLNMPGISGVEATARIATIAPLARVLVLSASDQDADVMDAIMAGACGYLLKEASIDELLAGIRSAAAGESLISPAIASKVLQRLRAAAASTREESTPSELSDRELQVLRLVANGADNAQIAAELHISPKTVKNHISNILMKLQIENRIQAAVFAVRSGLA
jgi:DNA-binding NarL/FixJ family response regulator